MAQLVDLHVHSNFSSDGHEEILTLCDAAVRAGVGVLAITDHYDYPACPGGPMEELAFERYVEAVQAHKPLVSDRVELLLGLEIGQIHTNPAAAEALIASAPFDIVLGSVHEIDEGNLYHVDYGTLRRCDAVMEEYLDDLMQMLDSDCFDVLAHIDFPLRKLSRWHPTVSLARYRGPVERVLKKTAQRGKALEINTYGTRSWKKAPSSDRWALEYFRRCGGEMVAIGSDAHRAGFVGSGSAQAVELLRQSGFDKTVFFRKRQPFFKNI